MLKGRQSFPGVTPEWMTCVPNPVPVCSMYAGLLYKSYWMGQTWVFAMVSSVISWPMPGSSGAVSSPWSSGR